MHNTEKECLDHLNSIDKLYYKGSGAGCKGVFDSVICWESVASNTTVQIPCPNVKGLFDLKKNLSKRCNENGEWEGIEKTGKIFGYTDFESCFTEAIGEHSDQIKNSQMIYNIVSHVELVGVTLSLICICFSLFIFGYHKNLRCKRTKIHLNLFITIFIQSSLRLLVILDRIVFKHNNPDLVAYESQIMLYNKTICPIITSLLEYIQMCNFMWMLNEGVYLNILLTYSVFDNIKTSTTIIFYCIGWGSPVLFVLTWFLLIFNTHGIDDICWSGYFNWKSYWIINAPILLALIVNILCLLNVIRILTNKLRENRTSEIEQIKKSAKAAILLLPLFGITHIFEVYFGEIPNWIFNLIFSILKAILVFYQGFFLSILYCFMNNEVKNVIKRNWLNKIKFKCFDLNKNRTLNRGSKADQDANDNLDGDNLLEMQLTDTNVNSKSNFSRTETEMI